MLKSILSTLRWSASIGNKIFHVVPGATFFVVISTLISQSAIVLASLLPLKVIMLLGATRIPGYFPSFFADIDRDFLIISLALLAVVFFIVHIVSEKLVARGAEVGAELLLVKSQKMALFENQKEIAVQGFQRYSRSLASSILLVMVMGGLCWLYFDLFLVLSGYVVFSFFAMIFLFSASEKIRWGLEESPGNIVNVVTNIGFLLAFGYMVVDFLWMNPPGLLVAVVSLILMRQGFVHISRLVNDLKGLHTQRLKLNALFFHGHVLVDEIRKHEVNFWSLLQAHHREIWIRNVLQGAAAISDEKIEVQWFQIGIPDVAVLHAEVHSDGSVGEEYLIKLFAANRGSQARHEATLLAGDTLLPSPDLVGVDDVEGLHCHVFRLGKVAQIDQPKAKVANLEVMGMMLSVEPESALVSRFSRSKPSLWHRVENKVLDRMKTVAEVSGGEDAFYVEQLLSRKGEIIRQLEKLPLTILNPDVGPGTILECENEQLQVSHWGRWSLEPAGAGWPVLPRQLDHLRQSLEKAREKRKAFQGVRENDVTLAALMYELERLCIRQQFVLALNLIPEILACVEGEPEKTPLAESKA